MSNYFMGQGKVYVATRNDQGLTSGLEWLGDCDKFELVITQKFDDINESYTGTRGTAAHIPTETTTSINMNLLEWSLDNLVRVMNGTTAGSFVAGTVTAEPIKAYAGTATLLEHSNVTALVVSHASTPLVAGTDYNYDPATGLVSFLPGSSVVTGSTPVDLTVAYSYAASAGKMLAMKHSTQNYYFLFVGINVADGSQVRVEAFKNAMNMPKNLGFLDSKHSPLAIDGMMLIDPSRTGNNQSPFFEILLQNG
jgi:hypothetical protein